MRLQRAYYQLSGLRRRLLSPRPRAGTGGPLLVAGPGYGWSGRPPRSSAFKKAVSCWTNWPGLKWEPNKWNGARSPWEKKSLAMSTRAGSPSRCCILPPTLYLGVDGTGVPMRAPEPQGRAGKQPDGSARTREAKLCTVWSAEKRDDQGRPPERSWLGYLHRRYRKRRHLGYRSPAFRVRPAGRARTPSGAALDKRHSKSS